jgi:hypothetical protein
MLQSLFKKVFGSRNDRLVKQYLQKVKAINALEPAMEKLSDAELAGKTAEFKSRLEKDETLDKLLPEAFAVVREASRRVLGMRQDRRDAHRRGQDADGDAAGLSERAGGQGRARGDGERLPGQPRRGVDGPAVRLSRPDHRRQPVADAAR